MLFYVSNILFYVIIESGFCDYNTEPVMFYAQWTAASTACQVNTRTFFVAHSCHFS